MRINILKPEWTDKNEEFPSDNGIQKDENPVTTTEQTKSQNLHWGNEEEKVCETKEEVKEAQEKPNRDIKEVMTNTSAEKSLDHSMATESLNETRIKENRKKPMDLIAEYRSTIMQRYTEKVLRGTIVSKMKHSDEKPMEKTSYFEASEEKKQLQSAKSQKVLTREQEKEKKSLSFNKSSESRKRHRSWKKEKANKTLVVDKSVLHQNKHRHRGSLDAAIAIGLPNESYKPSGAAKRKIPMKRQVELASGNLTMGEFMKLYKARRHSKELLNLAHMILVIIYPNYASQLFKIGVDTLEDWTRLTWKSAKNFLETHSKNIFDLLRTFPDLYFGSQKESYLEILKFINQHKLDYKKYEDKEVFYKFITVISNLYKYSARKQLKALEGIQKIEDLNPRNLFDRGYRQPIQTIEKKNLILCNTNAISGNSYKSNKTSIQQKDVQKQEVILKKSERVVLEKNISPERQIIEDTYKSDVVDEASPEPQEFPADKFRQEEPPLRKYKGPLTPIEEQLAKNEESKESLQDETTIKQLEEAIKSKTEVEHKMEHKPKQKRTQSRKNSGGKLWKHNYQTATFSWNKRASLYNSVRHSSATNSIARKRRYAQSNYSSSGKLNDPLRQDVKEKWISNKDWLAKIENRHKAHYNHYNISKKVLATKKNLKNKKKAIDDFNNS